MLVLTIRLRHKWAVSIHASRCWEAMHAGKFGANAALTQFQSTPPVAGRRCIATNGCCPHAVVSIHASRCWEAMLPEDPRWLAFCKVSIHASRCWEAMRFAPVGDCLLICVSIHASRCWEAMLIFCNYLKHKNKKPVLREPFHS